MRLLAASVVFALCAPAWAKESWDLAKCQQHRTESKAKAGHVCTPEHLEGDLAQLTQDLGVPTRVRGSTPKQLQESAEVGVVEAWAEIRKTAEPETTVRWAPDAVHSREFLVQGSRARLIVTETLSVLAFIESTDDPLRIQMCFLNKGAEPFDVIPDEFSLAVIEPKEKAKPLPYLSPKQVAKRIENAATWALVAEAIASAGRAMSGATTTSTSGTVKARDAYGGSAYGTYNGVTRTYDITANQQQTAANMARITDAAEANKIRQTTGALLPNTVFPGDSYGGVVHFKREKRAGLMILRAPVGGQVFEFPLEMPKK